MFNFPNKPLGFFIIVSTMTICLYRCIFYVPVQKENEGGYNGERISFGLVSCRESTNLRSIEETVVLMKSVLISAIRFKIVNVDFHVFLEHNIDRAYINKNLSEFRKPDLKVNLHTYSVFQAVPQKYHQRMLFKPMFRCTFARLFFPSAIPKHVDSIIYMDTDTIVTGNVWELWENLYKMRDRQLVGVVPNHIPETPVRYNLFGCFGTPYPPPLGLNAGLMIMNLTKMRKYEWEKKMLHHYRVYSRKTILEDQILLNILTQLDPGILYKVSCRFNVRCSVCEQWFLCKEAKEHGIVTVHGASGQFENQGRFHFLYEAYKKFDISNDNILWDLIMPLESTTEFISRKSGLVRDRCTHPVKHLLFKKSLLETFGV